MIYPFIIPTE